MASIQSRSGRLAVDFRYRGLRCREPTKLADTRPNRRRRQRVIDRIEAEIVLKPQSGRRQTIGTHCRA